MTSKLVRACVIVLAALAAALAAVGWYASEEVIHPVQRRGLSPAPFDLPLEPVSFLTRDGLRLGGWFVGGRDGATIVLGHGRGGDRSHMLPAAKYLVEAGFSVLLFDFRYRGASEGEAQTVGAREAWDVLGAVEYLKGRSDVDARRIGAQGVSMGAVASIMAAGESPDIKGVVAEIPFASVNHMLSHTFRHEIGLPAFPLAVITKWVSELRTGVDFDRLAPVDVIARISPRPVFLIDDLEDHLFPPDSVELLFAAAAEPKHLWQIPGCRHGRGYRCAGAEYARRVVAFWREALRR